MPKIKITEQDLTRSVTTSVLDTVIYIPGPCTDENTVAPTLCKTVDDLKALASVTGAAKIDDTSLSYRLAKYLIGTFNLYVLYEGLKKSQTIIPAESWTALQDTNNYDITFLTTGGYGYVDSNAAGCAGKRGDCTYLADTEADIGQASVPVYKLLKTEPADWPKSGVFPAGTPYYKLTGEYVPVIGTEAPEFKPNVYFLKEQTGESPSIKTDYILLTAKPSGWSAMVTSDEGTTKIYTAATTTYTSLAGKGYVTFATNTYYVKETIQGTWVENVRSKFDSLSTYQDYCAGFTPWFITDNINLVSTTSTTKKEKIPAAFGALFNYARMTQQTYPWFAAAGPNYGFLNEAQSFIHNCSNSECEVLQARSKEGEVGLDESGDNIGMAINPLTEVKPFGNILWGYRTARNNGDGLKATSFLNVRILVNILKKHLRRIARKYTFAQNDEMLWTNFSSEVITILDKMKAGRGIADYQIKKMPTSAKARLKAKIIIIPIEPVEDFELEIDLTDSLQVSE